LVFKIQLIYLKIIFFHF